MSRELNAQRMNQASRTILRLSFAMVVAACDRPSSADAPRREIVLPAGAKTYPGEPLAYQGYALGISPESLAALVERDRIGPLRCEKHSSGERFCTTSWESKATRRVSANVDSLGRTYNVFVDQDVDSTISRKEVSESLGSVWGQPRVQGDSNTQFGYLMATLGTWAAGNTAGSAVYWGAHKSHSPSVAISIETSNMRHALGNCRRTIRY
jgi:hypothetical protein